MQSKDASLRQMSYVVLKELTRSAEDIIMVTSSIMKDMATGSEVVYRANAVRAVIRVIDAQSAQAIERPLKTCIVDKSPVRAIASFAKILNIR
jgi:coatomer protein complex subunit gamma